MPLHRVLARDNLNLTNPDLVETGLRPFIGGIEGHDARIVVIGAIDGPCSEAEDKPHHAAVS